MSDEKQIDFELVNVYNDKELEQFREFHNLLFPNTAASEEWIKWFVGMGYRHHNVETRIYGAWDHGRLVGTWCVEPKRMFHEARSMKVGRCFSGGIHPDMRRQNLFVRLSKYAIERERQIQNYDYVIGFPQTGRPVTNAHLKSGWYNVQKINMYVAEPVVTEKPLSLSMFKQGKIRINYGDDSMIGVTMFFEKKDYLNNRWRENPMNCYVRLLVEDSFIVLKHYSDIMHVLALHGPNSHHLLSAARTLAARHHCRELNAWCSDNDVYRNVIERTGFVNDKDKNHRSIQMMAVNIVETDDLKIEKCVFHQGIEDVF